MKTAIVIPTFGHSIGRLDAAIKSIQRFTADHDYFIVVSDDATPFPDTVEGQRQVCDARGVEYSHRLEWGKIVGNFDWLGRAVMDRCDVICFFADDCLASQCWLDPIIFYYENNPSLKIGGVCGVMLEAWEMAMNGLIPHERSMYAGNPDGPNPHLDGTLERDDLIYTWDLYREAFASKRVFIDIPPNYCIGAMFVNQETGRYELNQPVALTGGIGPCFSLRSDVFKEVDGFNGFPLMGDFEVAIGLKCWDAGYVYVCVPSPPVYHARDMACQEKNVIQGFTGPQFDKNTAWTPGRMEELYPGFRTFPELQNWYHTKYCGPFTHDLAKKTNFMRREQWVQKRNIRS